MRVNIIKTKTPEYKIEVDQVTDLKRSGSQQSFSSSHKLAIYASSITLVIQGCNQSLIIALYIAIRDPAARGDDDPCIFMRRDTYRQNYRGIQNQPNESRKMFDKYSCRVSGSGFMFSSHAAIL